MITLVATTAGIYAPVIAVNAAGQDAWISMLVATLAALLIAWLIVGLVLRFPGKTLFEIPELIIGKIPGKIIAFLFVLWLIHIEILVFSEFGNFMLSSVLPGTPMFVNHIVAAIMIAYITRNVLEVISRFNGLFLPLFTFSIALLVTLSLEEMAATRLLPVFDCGMAAILKGSAAPVAWLGEIICLAAIIPYLNKPGQALRVAVLAALANGFIMKVNVLYPLAIYGPDLTASFMYPIYNGVRIISIANFLERLESIPVVIWITGGIIKVCVLRYTAVLGAAQCLGLKDYRPLVLPVGAVVVAGSLLMYQDISVTTAFMAETWPFYALTFEAGIPILLLVAAIARGVWGKE
jgi:spore germination protein KB